MSRSDGPWRAEVMEARGEWCRHCGTTAWVQSAHIWSKGQGGPSVVENGLPLCQPMHTAVDSSRDKIRFEWLDADQVAWLAEVGFVDWNDQGEPFGRGMRRFHPLTPAQTARR